MAEKLNPDVQKYITQQIIDNMKVDVSFNGENGALPFGFYNPKTEGKVYWVCNKDANGKITSVFGFKDKDSKDRRTSYLKDMDEAQKIRQTLIADGWKPMVPPKIAFKHPETDEEKILSRKEKRKLQRYITREMRKNPLLPLASEAGSAGKDHDKGDDEVEEAEAGSAGKDDKDDGDKVESEDG